MGRKIDREIVELYYSQKQMQFHIYSKDDEQRHTKEWQFLVKDEAHRILAFLNSKKCDQVFKLDSRSAKDFYDVWAVKQYGVSQL